MRFHDRRVFVTGGTGFIGGAIVRRLVAEGARVTCLVRPRTPATALDAVGATIVRGDVTDAASLDLADHDLVVHAAAWVGFGLPAKKLPLFRATNVQGTANVLAAAEKAGVAKFVHVSSVAALGAPGVDVVTEATPRPSTFQSEYERTKTEAHALVHKSPLPHAMPMPGLVLGREGPFEPLLQRVARRGLPALLSDDAEKGWVHVDDTAEGILLAALKGKGPYLLVDENARLTELLVAALEEAGLPVPRRRVPSRLVIGAATAVERAYKALGRTPPVSGELLRPLRVPMRYDATRARKELGWRPGLVARLADDLRAYAAAPSASAGAA